MKIKHLFGYTLLAFSMSCATNYGQLKVIANTGDALKENSGIQTISADGLIWAIEDSGNKTSLYGIDITGKLKREIKIKHAKNKDWEDITKDDQGTIYIGDFGNNKNKRKDLCIYKIHNPEKDTENEIEAEKIEFYYPEQKDFPPKKDARVFDAEAFFYLKNNFYIITKNRSKPFDGTTILYRIPATKGNHKAQLISSFKTCKHGRKCFITAADVSPNKEKVVLLGHTKIWVFSNFTDEDFFNGAIEIIDLDHDSQKEGVCFIDNNTLYISDEKTGTVGGNIYRLEL